MFPHYSKQAAMCLLLAGLAAPFPAVAEEIVTPSPTEMETVTVTGKAEDLLSGSSTLAGETLQQLPVKNGSIAEAITVLPHVQAGEGQRTSERGGEILPPLISISGARPYENYYSVDSVGLNSLLDPLADSPTAISSVPGHPQRTFINRNLIDSVTVYDSNVPARYGYFLGGVIDAKTRMPAKQFGGSISGRMTQDEWASQHIDDSKEDKFNNSTDHNYQPDYRKHEGSLSLDIPLNENSGLLAAYTTYRSEINLTHLGQDRGQDRILDNYFLKYAWNPDSPWALELTGTYTPSEETYFLKNTLDSDLTIDRGGYSLNGILTRKLDAGEVALSIAYLDAENSRTAPNEFKSWKHAPSTSWGKPLGLTLSQEGGLGDLETTEESLQIKADVALDPVQAGAISHTVSYGFAYTRDGGSYDRTETAYVYNKSEINPNFANPAWVVCAEGDTACVAGEQYFNQRNVYAAERASAVIHRQAYYVEDLLTFGRFSLRPGLRFELDDFLDNNNMAHRLTAGWDIFGNGLSRLSAGHNRYYSEALMTYKLREATTPYVTETRSKGTNNELSAWTKKSVATTPLSKFSELDTPFSDEFTVGFDQKLFGGMLSLNYLDRRHRDQFARETITEGTQKYYVLNNNGESNYESWSVGWERQWPKHYLNVNYTYAQSESTNGNESYDDALEDSQLDTQVWYDGHLIDKEELPRTDYYRPHVVNVIYVGRLPWGFTFTNVTKYQSGYEATEEITLTKAERALITSQYNIPSDTRFYDKKKRSGSTVFDWRLDWETRTYREQSLIVSLEINNVFDRKVKTGGNSDDTYELGREFWLGMTYKF
ncbi:MAG: hypothetical protein FIB02_03360 [Desulfuromonas sp.]|nr:hypothetical protein [Desulfuromonas sp.]